MYALRGIKRRPLVSDQTCRMTVLSSSRRRRRVSSTPAIAKPVCCSNEPHTPMAAAEANTEHHLCTCMPQVHFNVFLVLRSWIAASSCKYIVSMSRFLVAHNNRGQTKQQCMDGH